MMEAAEDSMSTGELADGLSSFQGLGSTRLCCSQETVLIHKNSAADVLRSLLG